MEIVDIQSAVAKPFEVQLDYGYVHDLIGKAIPVETIKGIIRSLEMQIVGETDNGLSILVPPYRVDVQRPCDVVEDILRIYGYNNIEIPKSVKSSLSIKGDEDRDVKLQNIVSEELIGGGFNEILNNSLTKSSYYQDLKSFSVENLVEIMNPLSSDLDVLRQTLLLEDWRAFLITFIAKIQACAF